MSNLTTDITAAPLAEMTAHPEYAALPHKERARLRVWVAGFQSVGKPGITEQLKTLAIRLDSTYPTVRRRYSEWQKTGDWRGLVDGRIVRDQDRDRTQDPEFIKYFKQLCESNQRATAPAIRLLKRQWKAKVKIPGYEDFPGWPAEPEGWSERNLRRLAPSNTSLGLMRRGRKAMKPQLAQVLRTRVGLWPGSHIQIDDVWHDNYVAYGDAVTRVLEFGAVDVLSANRFAWGSKPRMPKSEKNRAGIDGGHVGLTGREFRLFFASLLWNYGVSPRGTTFMLEHATASLPEWVVIRLKDTFGDLITIDPGGLSGEEQAILGMWGGRQGGHGNYKSVIESSHSLIHNELAALPGQTGKDRNSGPESTYGLVRYEEALLKWAKKNPDKAEHLQHPLLDYHTQFCPVRDYIYHEVINGRIDHNLEGWGKLGHYTTEYTLEPGSERWLDIQALPSASAQMVLAAAKQEPKHWRRHRALSPAEVWNRGKDEMIGQRNVAMVADLIGLDEGVERKVKGSYFRFENSDIDTEELIYEARITGLDGRNRELKSGESFTTLVNPYCPDCMIVLNAQGGVLGTSKRVHRVSHADIDGKLEMMGYNRKRDAERLQPLRERWEPEEKAAQDLRANNAALGFGGGKRRDSGKREARQIEARKEAQHRRAISHATEAPTVPASILDDVDDDCPFD